MKAFIGMLIMMGILHLPHLDMYWQVDEEILSTPGISEIMSRDKFLQIYRFLHLADNRQQHPVGHPRHDKLFKVRNLLNLVTAQCASNYTSHQAVTVDEAMIPFKGRLNFKQYMKNKPTKWGIKVFVLCDATNGYIYRMQIYTGKNMESNLDIGLCSRVVLELMDGLEGHEVYTDNYYTSPRLYMALYEDQNNACGTARTNRTGFPKSIIRRTTEDRGYYNYLSNGPLLAAAWYDRRFVYFLSTFHEGASHGETVRRTNPDGTSSDVSCPPLLPDYQ